MAAFFTRCHQKGIYWSFVNTTSSYLWGTVWFATLLHSECTVQVICEQCCHGGARKVSRKWLTNL
jgi:hypothetical protein